MNHQSIIAHISSTKSGTWKVRWREFNVSKQKTFNRKADALKLQQQLFNGFEAPVITKNLLFVEFCEIWEQRHCKINIEASTAIDYMQKVRAHIIPFFGAKPLAAIDEDDVIKFREWLSSERDLKPVSVGNYIRMVRLIFNCACQWKDDNKRRYLLSNPAKYVKEPKKPEPDFRFLTEGEIKVFLQTVVEKDPVVYEVALLALSTGMRRGEIYQLQRDCLDFENNLITVKRSFSFSARQVKHTKAGRIRRIPINSELRRVLMRYEPVRDPDFRIFAGVNIEHFHAPLRRWCLEAGVPVVGLHDLRDTFASSLVKAGVKIKVIQKLLGHVDIKVTERYMHLDPNDLEGSTDCLVTGVMPLIRTQGFASTPTAPGFASSF